MVIPKSGKQPKIICCIAINIQFCISKTCLKKSIDNNSSQKKLNTMKTKMFITMLAMAMLITGPAFSQKPSPAFTISAGISSALYYTDDYNSESSSSDLKTGANAGITYRLFTGKHWAVEPGLFYVQKGGVETHSVEGGSVPVKFKTSLNYLEVPVDMFYSKRNRFFWGFGPAMALGLSGKIKAEDQSVKIKFGSNTDD